MTGDQPHAQTERRSNPFVLDFNKAVTDEITLRAALEEADVLIGAVGQLNRLSIPDIPNLHDFKGPMFHTGRWNHDVDLTGQRVAMIATVSEGKNGCSSTFRFMPAGTGSSGSGLRRMGCMRHCKWIRIGICRISR